jgi:signal transduction histidine kinase
VSHPTGAEHPPNAATAHAWSGGERLWDSYFAVILVGTLVLVQVTTQANGPERLIASAALAAMVPWYLVAGRRAIYADCPPAWLGPAYLGGTAVLLAAAETAGVNNTFILLALGPQCFMALSYRRAIVAAVGLNLVPLAVTLARGTNQTGIAAAIAAALLGSAFCVVFGSWIIKIINQSSERADLIAQLERTREALAEADREAGRLAERARLATEIHDTIAQGFTSIVMLVQAADAVLGRDEDRTRAQLDLIGATARENLAEARALVAGLGPAPLATASLPDALSRQTDRVAQESGLTTSFEVHGTPRPLETRAEVVLLRVGQEALANVRKHASARTATVELCYRDDGGVRLAVTDDGAGFDPAMASDGFGLAGMRARLDEIGGALSVRTEPGLGTTITAEVP